MSVYQKLLTTCTPPTDVEGTEGLVDGIINVIKNVIKKIVEGIKWLWNKLFGSGGDVSDFKKGLKDLKGAKLKSDGFKINKRLLYFVKRENWGDVPNMLKDLTDTAGTFIQLTKELKGRMVLYTTNPILENYFSDRRIDKKSKIDEEFNLGPNFTIKFSYDPKENTESTVIDKTVVTSEEVDKNNSFFYMTRPVFEILVKQLTVIGDDISGCEKAFQEMTKVWETHFKNFVYSDKFKTDLNENLEALNKQYVVESAHYLNLEFKLIKTLWINFTKEIEEFKILTESFTEK